jgi:hypothetical protein
VVPSVVIKFFHFSIEIIINSNIITLIRALESKMYLMPTNRLDRLKTRERELAGFILNKLWVDRYWCGGVGGHHLGHTALSNVPKGRPRSEHGEALEVIEKLKRFGFITIFPATHEMHVCASRADEMITEGLVVVNEYRQKVGLPALKRDQI